MRAAPSDGGERAGRAEKGSGSGLLRALRYPTDELQLGRVIAAACATSPEACMQFVEAVLSAAAEQGGEVGARAAAHLRALPADVRCEEQERLLQDRAAALHSRAEFGTVDLVFYGSGGWRLLCEVKLNSQAEELQRERYVQAGHRLVSIVRERTETSPELQSHEGWLGETRWHELLPRLEQLALPPAEAPVWREILTIAVADGEFDLQSPRLAPGEADEKESLALEHLLKLLLMRGLRQSFPNRGGEIGAFLERLTLERGVHGDWVSIRVLEADDLVLAVTLRRTATLTPECEVWLAPHGGIASIELEDSLKQQGFIPSSRLTGSSVWSQRRTARAEDVLSDGGAGGAIAAAVEDMLDDLIQAGGLDDYLGF